MYHCMLKYDADTMYSYIVSHLINIFHDNSFNINNENPITQTIIYVCDVMFIPIYLMYHRFN